MKRRSACGCRVCRGQKPGPDWTDGDRQAVQDVERHGWHVVRIPAEDRMPGWAFTLGLRHTFGTPDLAVSGLAPDVMHTLLNDFGESVRRGERLVLDQRRAGLLDRYDVVVRPVDPRWHRALFGHAVWFAPDAARELAQVVWPDMDGRFPWEAGFDESVRRFQADLWEPPALAPPGPWRVAWREEEWPPRPHATGLVFASKAVATGDAAATIVKVFADGDWAFLVEGPFDADNVVLLHLHHVLLDDPSLDGLITLAPGTMATRSGPGDAWEVSRHND